MESAQEISDLDADRVAFLRQLIAGGADIGLIDKTGMFAHEVLLCYSWDMPDEAVVDTALPLMFELLKAGAHALVTPLYHFSLPLALSCGSCLVFS